MSRRAPGLPQGLTLAEEIRYTRALQTADADQWAVALRRHDELRRAMEAEGAAADEIERQVADVAMHDSLAPIPRPPEAAYREEYFVFGLAEDDDDLEWAREWAPLDGVVA